MHIIELAQLHIWFWLLLVALVSLCVGSFLNVVIHRLPIMIAREKKAECQGFLGVRPQQPQDGAAFNLMYPPSHCPRCKVGIKAWQNIPVVSWLLLGGKCNGCKSSISARYPLVEAGTALLSVVVAWLFGPTLSGVLYIFTTWILVTLAFMDYDEVPLPNQLTVPMLWLVLVASAVGIGLSPSKAIIGATVGYVSLWCVNKLYELVTNRAGFQSGYVVLLAFFGALIGWKAVLLLLVISVFVGGVIEVTRAMVHGRRI